MIKLKAIKLDEVTYQIEAGRKVFVFPAKSLQEAKKKVCKYLGIKCNKLSLVVKGGNNGDS